MTESRTDTVPAFLSIDVEPDRIDPSRNDSSGWTGWEAMVEYAGRLRIQLTERSGSVPKFGWYFRTDPQIGQVYGRPEYALTEYKQHVADLVAHNDYFGVHAHTLR